ncbi:NAD-dependent epimerase/dehydratase [Roseibacterium elongatum DSM 19469]|uniref:NAD-dependent epimerase/dehydratase n=1 Tax=Roseicyclus elongatus DSM 19469 TaxID=1294273 RepID=W8RQU9_9RHOB|nr:complex I NDUFA9 subunit family protein [Roseibacterium elongatum]AHM03423.1 NAD-dependent epimerase/dehydratase [Roseibacterium elongatum DSM 19469]
MAKLVTIFGGSGFVGRYIARRMAREGWRVRVAVRRPNEALFVRPYGAVGQVEPIFANVRDDDSVRAAIHGADVVVNCVGILSERGKNKFGMIQHHGAARVARIATEEGVTSFVQISAIGADSESNSLYAESKGKGEEAVLEAFPTAIILRPSIVFGPEDEFFNRFAKMTRTGFLLPVVGASTRFQPVYVDDVAKAAVKSVKGQVEPGIYELGGPDVKTFRELMEQMLEVIRRRRLIVNVPFWIASIMAGVLDTVQMLTGGLLHNALLTRDQVRNLRRDNVVSEGRMGLSDLGIEPVGMDAVLEDYLWPYRPSGQYSKIKESAKNLAAEDHTQA